MFDPAKVAKREEGSEDMLEGLIVRWIDEVISELDGVKMDRRRGGRI